MFSCLLHLSTDPKAPRIFFQVHNQYCLVTDFSNNVVLVDTSVTDHTDFSEKCLQRLPINNSAPVAVADFDPHDQTVVVVYANHQVYAH